MNIAGEIEKVMREHRVQPAQAEALTAAIRLFDVIEQIQAVSLKNVLEQVNGTLLKNIYEQNRHTDWCEAWQRIAYEALIDASPFADRSTNVWQVPGAKTIPIYRDNICLDASIKDVPNHNISSLILGLRNSTSSEATVCRHMAGIILDINPEEIEAQYPDIEGWLTVWRKEAEALSVKYDCADSISRKDVIQAIQALVVCVEYERDMPADQLVERCMDAFKDAAVKRLIGLPSLKK